MKPKAFLVLLSMGCFLAFFVSGLRAAGTLKMGEGSAAPRQTNVSVPISFLVDPEGGLIMGLEFAVRYDASVLAGVSIEAVDDVDFFNFMDQQTFEEDGTTGVGMIWDLGRWAGFTNSRPVATLEFCVLPSAAPGTYPIEILAETERRPMFTRNVIRTIYTEDGYTRVPLREAGAITIAGESVSGGSCEPDDRSPPVHDPKQPLPDELLAHYSLRDRTARPGTTFHSPLIINGNVELRGFSFSIDFDEGVLQGTAVEDIWERPNGEDYDFRVITINNRDDTPGSDGVDEGFVVGSVIFSMVFVDPDVLPRDQDNEVLDLHFLVRPDVGNGFTLLAFVDGARGSGEPIKNLAHVHHVNVPTDTFASTLFVNSLVAIVGDASAFVRGDANDDGTLNLGDAKYTLDYLFVGGPAPVCSDAADANDDGELDLSDATKTLGHLFMGEAVLPPPTQQQPGPDLTLDTMGCGPRSS